MQHITMFKPFDNELGYIKCVIGSEQKQSFIDEGFVDNANSIITPELIKKAKSLKIKGYTKMDKQELIDKISEAENANNKG